MGNPETHIELGQDTEQR